jgi:hypothetical protein
MHYKKTAYAVSSSYNKNYDNKDSMKLNVQQQYCSLLIIYFIYFWNYITVIIFINCSII